MNFPLGAILGVFVFVVLSRPFARCTKRHGLSWPGMSEGDDLVTYELASYAPFFARPSLHRVQATTPGRRTVSLRVTSVLEPIAPDPKTTKG
jgi:hypothetical protein